jgi:hypothetical protein
MLSAESISSSLLALKGIPSLSSNRLKFAETPPALARGAALLIFR